MEQMKLKDFIQNALVEIAEGVRGANKKITDGKSSVFCLKVNRGDSKAPGVIFDVAVTASKEGKDSSGFMVALVNLGGGAKAERAVGKIGRASCRERV